MYLEGIQEDAPIQLQLSHYYQRDNPLYSTIYHMEQAKNVIFFSINTQSPSNNGFLSLQFIIFFPVRFE